MAKHKAMSGVLTRLLHNQAGNTLAIVAASILPLLGLVGGGVDMSRLYLTRARLQQACDAGALAGRKQMGGGSWSANSGKANTNAVNMFKANFQEGSYGTTGGTPTFTESSGKVTGTASVQVPMTIMKVFGQSNKTISVTCDAEMRIPNTDVMFVLDVTGSMGETNSGDSSNKITGLKKAVKCFYEALAKINTDADCGSTPSSGNSSTVQLRFGFVPYSSNVNVGRLLNNDWIANNWTYQSRRGVFYQPGPPSSKEHDETSNQSSDRRCKNWSIGDDAVGFPSTSSTPDNFVVSTTTYTYSDYNKTTEICTRRVNESFVTYTKDNNGSYFHTWLYAPTEWSVSGFKAGGSSWNSSISLPVGSDGEDVPVNWDGCIEERQTVRTTNFSPIPDDAFDLNIDMVPDPANATTQWGPLLPDAVWNRYNGWGKEYDELTTDSDLNENDSYACPVAARRLKIYKTTSEVDDFESYVDSLSPTGNTYHDIGMIWGARLISPTGLFGSDNAFTPTGGQIERHIIFMTDGDACTGVTNYTAYGVHWWDRRQTSASSEPTDGCTDTGNLTEQVNIRTAAICSAVKNMNVTLWVISFGSGVTGSAQTKLKNCASTGRFYSASNSADLISNFQAIANEISQLRLTK